MTYPQSNMQKKEKNNFNNVFAYRHPGVTAPLPPAGLRTLCSSFMLEPTYNEEV